MKKKELIKKLNSLQHKIKPDQAWQQANREILLSQIKAQTRLDLEPKPEKILGTLISNQLVRISVRSLATVCAVFLIVCGTWIATVSATKNSLPGDILYGLKLTTERVQINLTLDDEKRTNLELEFADRRLDEVRQVMSDQDSEEKNANIDVALEKFQENLDNVKSNLAKLEIKDTPTAVKIANMLEEKTDQYVDTLKEHSGSSPDLVVKAEQAISASKATADKALAVIIKEYESGQSDLSFAEVVNKINRRIDNIQAETNLAKANIATIITNKELAVLSQEAAEAEEEAITEEEQPAEEENTEAVEEEVATEEDSEQEQEEEQEEKIAEPVATEDSAEETIDEQVTEESGESVEEQSAEEIIEQEPTEEILPTIEEIKDKPAEIPPLLTEAKELLVKREVGPAFDKVKQADDILALINKVINANLEYLPQEQEQEEEVIAEDEQATEINAEEQVEEEATDSSEQATEESNEPVNDEPAEQANN